MGFQFYHLADITPVRLIFVKSTLEAEDLYTDFL